MEAGAFEVNTTLSSLLDRVERGEEIVITRGGKPVARLVPEAAKVDRSKQMAAVEHFLANRKIGALKGLNVKDLINEGRP